jgi:hypothetical protein
LIGDGAGLVLMNYVVFGQHRKASETVDPTLTIHCFALTQR